jgi:hypothetical protein
MNTQCKIDRAIGIAIARSIPEAALANFSELI